MATISYKSGPFLSVIKFDATMRESTEATQTVTDHPVEKGANVSDHQRLDLAHVTLDVVVTNTPLVPVDTISITAPKLLQLPPRDIDLPISLPGIGAALSASGILRRPRVAAAMLQSFPVKFNRISDIYEELLGLMKAGTLVAISTAVKQFENMAIVKVSAPRESGSGGSSRMSIEARELIFVETETVTVPKTTMAVKKISKGVQTPTVPEGPEQSVLSKLKDQAKDSGLFKGLTSGKPF